MTPDTEAIKLLPSEVAAYLVFAVVILYIAKKMYGDSDQRKDEMLSRQGSEIKGQSIQLKQFGEILSNFTQSDDAKSTQISGLIVKVGELQAALLLAAAREDNCMARMERLEKRSDMRIAELLHEVDQLRGDVSEVLL